MSRRNGTQASVRPLCCPHSCLPADSPAEAVLYPHLPAALAELPVCVHAHSPENILSTSSLGHRFLLLWGWPGGGGSVVQPLLCPPYPHSCPRPAAPPLGSRWPLALLDVLPTTPQAHLEVSCSISGTVSGQATSRVEAHLTLESPSAPKRRAFLLPPGQTQLLLLLQRLPGQLSPSPGLFALLPQVPGCRAPVLVPGHTAHPLRQHPGPSTQAAALLSELRGDHAQRGGGRQDQHRGVPAPVPRPQVELHHHQQQPGHLRPRAGQRYASGVGGRAACWCSRPKPAALLCPRVSPAPPTGGRCCTRLVISASLMWFLPMVTGAEGAPGAQEGHRITPISLTCPP